MAAAVEHVNLHKRIALNMMKLFGTTPKRLILSFMIPTAFLSMWISNTATTALMLPIMQITLTELEKNSRSEIEHDLPSVKNKMKKILSMAVCVKNFFYIVTHFTLENVLKNGSCLVSLVSTTLSSLFIFSQYAHSQAGRTKTAGP